MSEKKHKDENEDRPEVPTPEEPAAEDVEAGGEPSPADPNTALEQQRDDLLGRLQRLSADYVNYQKRAQRDIDQAREFANEQLIKDLLAVLDDMERAIEAARANHPEDDPLLVGTQLVHDKAVDVLGRYGLTAIEAQGKPFDPELHQAIMMQPTDEQPAQTVLAEAIKGYQLRGRTIRPSSVVVAVPPQQDQPAQE